MKKHPSTGRNIWGPKEYADIIRRAERGQKLKDIGKIYGVSASSICTKLRNHRILKERIALEGKRRLDFIDEGSFDPDYFINDEDQHKEDDYYT